MASHSSAMTSYLCKKVDERHDAIRVGRVVGVEHSRDRWLHGIAFRQPVGLALLVEQWLRVVNAQLFDNIAYCAILNSGHTNDCRAVEDRT